MESAKATDGLMECAWRRLQYKWPLPPADQVAKDLAFWSAVNVTCLPGMQLRVLTAAAVMLFQYPPPAFY